MNPEDIISFVVIVLNMSVGLFLFLRPTESLEIQRRFYLRINWRIEPVDMEKELRNTKAMGALLIASAICVSIYKWV